MLQFQGEKILKHRFYNSSGQEIIKTYKFKSDIEKNEIYSLHNVIDIQTNMVHTLKIIFKSALFQKDKIVTEIQNMKIFYEKQNFISLYDVYEDQNSIFMIMEEWGITLSQLIRRRTVLLQYQVQIIFSQLIDIICQLRSKNISHGNISLQSIYIDTKKNNLIKLGQFCKSFDLKYYFQEVVNIQNSQQLQKTINQYKNQLSSQTSTIPHLKKQKQEKINVYTSPEKLKLYSSLNSQNQYLKVQQLYDNDIWSIGVILFRLLVGRFPFIQNQNFDQQDWIQPPDPKLQMIKQPLLNFTNPLLKCVQSGQKLISNQNLSVQFKQLIRSILTVKSKRIKLKDLINHPLKINNYYKLNQKCSINFNSVYCPLNSLNQIVMQGNINQINFSIQKMITHDIQVKQKASSSHILSNYSYLSLYSQKRKKSFLNKNNPESNSFKFNNMWKLNFQKNYGQINQQQKNLSFLEDLNNKNVSNHEALFKQFQTCSKQNEPNKLKDLDDIFQSQQDFQKQNFPLVEDSAGDLFNKKNPSHLKSAHFKQESKDALYKLDQQNIKMKKLSQTAVKHNRFTIRSIKDRKNLINPKGLNKQSISSSISSQTNGFLSNSQAKNSKVSGWLKVNNFSDGFDLNKIKEGKTLKNNYPQLNKLNKCTLSKFDKSQISDEENIETLSLKAQKANIIYKLVSNRFSDMPLIIQQPPYVFKYKYKKQYDSFGYVLDHGIGVIFSDGQHVIGHDQNDYKYIQNNNKILPSSKMSIFKYYLNYFGKRVIYGTLSVWIQKYWRDGKIFVFLMSNGCWEVSFQMKKTCKFYVIDENDLSWNKQNAHVDIMNIVRNIVNCKKQLMLRSFVMSQNQP